MEPKIDIETVREDSGKDTTYVKRKSRRKKKKRRILIIILSALLVILAVLIGCGWYLIISGKSKIEEKGKASRPVLEPVQTEEQVIETELLDENTLKYKGVKYRYNEDMINLLFMGTDTTGKLSEKDSSNGEAGQADAIFLAALDNKKKKVTLIPINRDTMTEISIYDLHGQFIGKQTEQLALSYAYGDGEQQSAELTKEAVSNLFYGLPIHGYFAVNISTVPIINDMLGGVELELMEDFTDQDPSYIKGAKVVLNGEMARTYIQSRYSLGDGSNESRMSRQKQYLTALIGKAVAAVKSDMTLPVTLYQTVADYMVTDVSVNEVSYLASQAVGYSIPGDFIKSISGTSEKGEAYMEFTVDEAALYELILDVFYDKVDD